MWVPVWLVPGDGVDEFTAVECEIPPPYTFLIERVRVDACDLATLERTTTVVPMYLERSELKLYSIPTSGGFLFLYVEHWRWGGADGVKKLVRDLPQNAAQVYNLISAYMMSRGLPCVPLSPDPSTLIQWVGNRPNVDADAAWYFCKTHNSMYQSVCNLGVRLGGECNPLGPFVEFEEVVRAKKAHATANRT